VNGTANSTAINTTTTNAFNNALSSSGADAVSGGETSARYNVATLNENGGIALWNAQHGILEFLEIYRGSDSNKQVPKCLQWVSLPSTCTTYPSSHKNPSSVVSSSTTAAPGASPLNVLLIGAGRDLLAMYPNCNSPRSSAGANYSEIDVLQEVGYTILSLLVLDGGGGNNLLLVLQTRDASSTGNGTFASPTYVTLFDIQLKSTPVEQQQQKKIVLEPLGSMDFGRPSSFFSVAVTAVTPLPFSLATLTENSRLCLLVGTATGQVHTVVLPFTDSGTLDTELCHVSKPVNLAFSSSSSSSASSLAVVALAVDDESNTAAAVLVNNSSSTGLTSTKSYLALWKVQQPASSNTRTSFSTTTTTTSTTTVTSSSTAAAASPALATTIRIPLKNPGCSVSWISNLIVPCVAVGDICGNITFYAPVRDATEGWKAVAKVKAANAARPDGGEERAAAMAKAVCCLHGGGGGGGGGGGNGPVIGAVGSRVVCVSDEVVVDHELKPLSR
jgi:hypothetical protein